MAELDGSTNGIKRHIWSGFGAVIGLLVLQVLALIWWAGRIDARMESVERHVDRIDARVLRIETGGTTNR